MLRIKEEVKLLAYRVAITTKMTVSCSQKKPSLFIQYHVLTGVAFHVSYLLIYLFINQICIVAHGGTQ